MVIDKIRAAIHRMTSPVYVESTAAGMGPPALDELRQSVRKHIRASYDSVARTPENTRHWMWTDVLSADASLNPDVRKSIRSMARYEVNQNNSYGVGIAQTLANDTIGTGPKLQLQFAGNQLNDEIERQWNYWFEAVDLRQKLQTMRLAKMVDGEAIARAVTNVYTGEPVTLDYQLIECDQLTTPNLNTILRPDYVDGIHLDRFGNAYAYDILKSHPGSDYWTNRQWEYNTYTTAQIIHIFRQDRPGQHHGVSEFAAALPLFAFLRRFTLATVAAAETAASVSQVIETDAPIPEELEADYAASTFEKFMEAIPIDRNSATVLPNQWKLRQFSAEHPTTTYRMFKQELINEIARVVNMPRNIAAADSSDYNYASGRLDHMTYQKSVTIEQSYFGMKVLDKMFADWLLEAAVVGELTSDTTSLVLDLNDRYGRMGMVRRVPHAWYWDGFKDADQTKEADAQRTKLASGTTHRGAEYAAKGLDVNVEDMKAAQSFGITVDEYRELVGTAIFKNGNAGNDKQSATTPQPADTQSN